MTGETISHYRVGEKLGGGGMGVVYRAEDLKLGREVAFKFLPDEVTGGARAVERFEQEARAAAAINHPNICTVHEIAEFEGSPYISMELLEGETLKQKIQGKPLPLDTILDWAIQICDALDAAHVRGIVHRDLKPANLFITNRSHAKVLDFGLAKLRSARAAAATTSVAKHHDGRADEPGAHHRNARLYVSGTSARRTTRCTNGPFQFECGDVRDGDRKIAFSRHDDCNHVGIATSRYSGSSAQSKPSIADRAGRIISKALEKDRDIRYQSAADLRADLKRLRRDTDLRKSTPGKPTGARRRRQLWMWVGAALLVIAVTTAVFEWRHGQQRSIQNMQNMTIRRLTDTGDVRMQSFLQTGSTSPSYREGPNQVYGCVKWPPRVPCKCSLRAKQLI